MKIRKIVMAFAVVLFAACVYVKPAEAAKAVKPITLKNEKTISKYDVTGDGKKDKVKITCSKSSENWADFGDEWKIMVNGKCVRRISSYCCRPDVQLYRVSTKRVYLAIEEQTPYNDDINGYALFQMKKGKLQKICDFYHPIAKSITDSHYYVNISKMTSKSMTVECSDQLYATGRIVWHMNYVYKNGKWKKTGNVYRVFYDPDKEWIDHSSGWTANRKLNVYTTTSLKKKAFTVKKGEVVKIKKLCIKNGNTYIQLTNKRGKKGWIKNPKKYSDGYFKEVHFAG